LPEKFQEIKDRELAKRAKKSLKQEQKASASADIKSEALATPAQTNEVESDNKGNV
jgi:phage pi2 protein 07